MLSHCYGVSVPRMKKAAASCGLCCASSTKAFLAAAAQSFSLSKGRPRNSACFLCCALLNRPCMISSTQAHNHVLASLMGYWRQQYILESISCQINYLKECLLAQCNVHQCAVMRVSFCRKLCLCQLLCQLMHLSILCEPKTHASLYRQE